MVFEQFLESDDIKKHGFFIFLLGIFYAILGYGVADYFFPGAVSVATLFIVTLALTPSIFVILGIEEKIEAKQGTKHFFHNHLDIFRVYICLFFGIFLTFLIAGLFFQNSVFDYQMGFLEERGDLSKQAIEEFRENDYQRSFTDLFNLITFNVFVVVICFILSIFYGAGALFLIVFNASVFAAFISYVFKEISESLNTILLFLIHLVPELSGFLVAAISGGVVSRAIVDEKFASPGFKNVMKDALILLLISLVLIIIAAILEVYVTAPLAKTLI